jgi:hypothetical protein
MGKTSLIFTEKVSATATLLLSPKDKKRFSRLLKAKQVKAATYIRDLVLIDLMKYEAKKAKA